MERTLQKLSNLPSGDIVILGNILVFLVFSKNTYSLTNSVIYDTGASHHIYNNLLYMI